jgi:hypothetical protein
MPVLAPLQMELLVKRPPNIKEYCIEWLKRYSILCTIQATLPTMTPRNSLVTRNLKRSSRSDAGKD